MAFLESEHGLETDSGKMQITDIDIIAQAFNFFLGGFNKALILMTFLSYEVAINENVQSKLQQEVDETYEKCQGNVTYEAILNMKYLDMVICETLRKWPSVPIRDRKAIRDFTLKAEPEGESDLFLDRGSICWLPIFAIHRDAKYYPDPQQFDPERFSEKTKHNINTFAYLPFGIGPRNCIGSRFALLENKVIIFQIIRNFEIIPIARTTIPVVLDKGSTAAKGGMWLGFKKREANI